MIREVSKWAITFDKSRLLKILHGQDRRPLVWTTRTLGEPWNKTTTTIKLPYTHITFGHGFDSLSPRLGKELDERVRQIAVLLNEINRFTSFGHFISQVQLTDWRNYGREESEIHTILIDIWHPALLGVVTHETGHAVLKNYDPAVWRFIYYYFLADEKSEKYALVDDGSYMPANWPALRGKYPFDPRGLFPDTDAAGHPRENPSELFASTFSAFVRYPDQFLARITAPKLPGGAAKFGRLLWLYLRDVIFRGKTFGHTDPFHNQAFRDALKTLTAEEMFDSLQRISANQQSNFLFRKIQGNHQRQKGHATFSWIS